tara:strand:- start:927 stop:2099 length:1173 start_codon:yes stop_codon:yes gene_type:complete
MTVEYYKPNQLIMAEYNPRQLTKDQHSQLKDSIKRFGLVDPLIVNKNKERKNILVGGHQRLRIAKELGINKIPCVEVDLNMDQEKELNIRLNKNVGEWDYDSLANYFDVGELMDWGFTDDELQFYEDEPEQGLIEDDEIPEVEEAITKQGDLWILGEHRLLCGDATKKEDVDLLMDGKKADMVFTDPPYNVDYNGGTKKRSKIKNDNINNFFEFLYNSFLILNDFMINGASIYVTHADMERKNFTKAFLDANFKLSSILIWVKNNSTFGRQDYFWKHEPILYGWKKGNSHKWYGDFKQDTIWNIDRPSKSKKHPTMKPIELIIKAINNSSKIKNILLDVFLGSGSTLIACEKTNRKCYGMELDPHYCDVIVKRWEEFTGKKAKRVERAEG